MTDDGYPLTKQGVRNLDGIKPPKQDTLVQRYPRKPDKSTDLFSGPAGVDLLYDDNEELQEEILSQFPDAALSSDWDYLHGSRLTVSKLKCSVRRWFKFLIQSGWATLSLQLQMAMIEHSREVAAILDEIDPSWRSCRG